MTSTNEYSTLGSHPSETLRSALIIVLQRGRKLGFNAGESNNKQ